jgi:DNA-binding SARP family transcriptional activator
VGEGLPPAGSAAARRLSLGARELLKSGWSVVLLVGEAEAAALAAIGDCVELTSALVEETVRREGELLALPGPAGAAASAFPGAGGGGPGAGRAAQAAPAPGPQGPPGAPAGRGGVYVRLLGGFRAYKGGEPIADSLWSRSKARALFALLALRPGRGLSRSEAVEAFWPGLGRKRGLDNLHTAWSLVRRALRDEGGGCPYVRNDGNLYRADPALVASDAEELERVAKRVLLGGLDDGALTCALMRLEELYAGDLLEGAGGGPAVERAAKRCRGMATDAYVSAAAAMLGRRNFPAALWFARKALDTDGRREDVYRTLMEVQSAAGQRTCALETYFSCKDYLDKELGLSLSRKTIELYERVISGEGF